MKSLDALLADLQSGDDELAESAAGQVPAYGADAFSALCQLRQSQDADLRWWAVRTMAQLDASFDPIRELIAALDDPSGEVKQCAALALCQHPAPEAVLPLIQALSTSDSLLTSLASNALIKIGKDAVPALMEFIKQGKTPGRLEAVRALAEIRDHRAIPMLFQLIQQDALVTQYWAEQGLDKLGLTMAYFSPD